MKNVTLEVDRADHGRTRLVEEEVGELGPNQVRFRIDRFALTANNVTYATVGDMLGYWDFFPTEEGWGRIPAMGWADVVESTHPDVPVGGRYFGWYPMSRFVDMTVGVSQTGIRDDGDHRAAHAAVYRNYVDSGSDPYREAGDGYDGETEDRHALVRGLFLTGVLADEFFADRDYDGCSTVVVLSASSKTAISFAQRAAARGVGELIGVTSERNADFVAGLGYYDRVVSYDDLESLGDAGETVVVDLSGNTGVVARVHDQLGDRVKYSMLIGFSHHDAPQVEVATGPTPEMFFAPTEVDRRMAEWGPEEYSQRMREALGAFVDATRDWMAIERVEGAEGADDAYHRVRGGAVTPDVGLVVSLH